uniref:Glycosyltransferase family 92 protein n=2 Tax=Caenorhabditis tropicalis TaxID=1561998 RepID=A0A1I7T6J3_9PELO
MGLHVTVSSVYRFLFVLFLLLGLNYLLFYEDARKLNTELQTSQCEVPEWNQIETDSVSTSLWNAMSRWLWMALDLSKENNQNYTSIILIGAYVYPEYISITLNSQFMVKQRLYCRYFDCKKQEIYGSEWQGIVFPESVVQCPRRIGAEFVGVSRETEEEIKNPMRLVFRNYDKPVHDLAICVAPLYGSEPKWIQIVEFIEHHKMEGATFFYFHIGNISDYDRRVLDEYVNNGDIEVKVMQEKYERPFYAWQLIEIQDCHMRAKYHSKWTTFIDIDERISTSNGLLNLLNSVDNGKLAEVQMPILNIVKSGNAPEKYENEEQVRREMISMKYNKTAGPTWDASKALIRPEKVSLVIWMNLYKDRLQIGIMSIHYAVALDPGYTTKRINHQRIVLRHYRTNYDRENSNNWERGKRLTEAPLPLEFSSELRKRVVEKVQDVYEKVPVNCSTIPEYMWKSRKFPDPCERMLITW